MKPEYDLTKMKSRPNPYAKKLKQQVSLSLGKAISFHTTGGGFI